MQPEKPPTPRDRRNALPRCLAASLADAVESYRQLLLVHAMTDAAICFSFAAAAFYLPALRQGEDGPSV